MSDTDSFIEEVNDEVRRDRLYGYLRRYGWIAILAVVLIVGSAGWSEYRKAQDRAEAEALGDAMLAALASNDSADRMTALAAIEPGAPSSAAVLELLTAGVEAEAGENAAAVATLNEVSVDADVPEIYRQIARFKSIALQADSTPVADRRLALETLAQPGNPLRMLALEQLALIDIAEGDADAAIARYQSIISDAETTRDLQARARELIVALGGDPEIGDFATQAADTAEETGN